MLAQKKTKHLDISETKHFLSGPRDDFGLASYGIQSERYISISKGMAYCLLPKHGHGPLYERDDICPPKCPSLDHVWSYQHRREIADNVHKLRHPEAKSKED